MKIRIQRYGAVSLILVFATMFGIYYSSRHYPLHYEGGIIRFATDWKLLNYKLLLQEDTYDLDGRHLERSFPSEASMFFPKSHEYTKRFQLLSPKLKHPKHVPHFESPAVIRRSTPGLKLYGEDITIEESGELWMLSNSDLLLFRENETQLLRIDGKQCKKLSAVARQPEFGGGKSRLYNVYEPAENRILTATLILLGHPDDYRVEQYHTEYYAITDDKLELIASWQVRSPDNSVGVTHVIADKLVYLDDKDENLVFRRIDNAEIIQELRLPIVGGEVDYSLSSLGFMRELVFDGWKKRVLSSTDLSEIPELPITKVPPGEYRLEYWDHPNETAWFSSKEHVVGFRRSDQAIVGPIKSPFRIVSTEYLEDRHSLLLLGDRPKRWAFVDLTTHALTKP